ncbi:MAG: sulfotransferase [Phycisphaerales bacterium]
MSVTPHVGFLFASPRSGTTWMMHAISAHPSAYCTEHRLFGPHRDEVLDEGAHRPRLRITLDTFCDAHARHLNLIPTGLAIPAARDRVMGALADRLFQLDRELTGKPVVIDKVTPYVGTAERAFAHLREFFPPAPIVRLVRDGRDVAVSGVHHWLTKRIEGSAFGAGPAERDELVRSGRGEVLERLFTDEELEVWARMWAEPCRAADRQATIYFERLIEFPEEEFARLLEALAIPASDKDVRACLDAARFEHLSGGRARGEADPIASVRSGEPGEWRRWFTRRDGEVFESIAGDQLAALGYAEPGWAEKLPEKLTQLA